VACLIPSTKTFLVTYVPSLSMNMKVDKVMSQTELKRLTPGNTVMLTRDFGPFICPSIVMYESSAT
jgi:hypothetical protein